ncbi:MULTISPECIES: acetyl-CoA hydrolase/transferase C-terminal domain-containing protein [unclassified Polaromonas]|uniref:acetyl-CoA hydrolase/transferase C-terminal domain-containing protein n=1 Tax=unclassified Polaromonas TaxID=2638319 RepID=UPI000F091B4F|nr:MULTISPECIES: acetyl-CoA hydrolase/transferase C-terminal domain-containing protein [unclassified Polaromonas]AYQ30241.1 acetyl-CoA hydrolase [Polaromonas sp. SP1]QGJ18644.1 acetyl-CoA hydrolase [Polaromonas sp. Pch-P]
MATPLVIPTLAQAVEHVLTAIDGDIVLGLPLGIGKPNPFVNLLYRRIKATGSDANPRRLKIITALSLEKPEGKSELEQNFLTPLVERVFKDYPDLDYVKDLRAGVLPPHIEVSEFFLKTGDYLGNERAQQAYIATNYTFVARDMGLLGVNVIAQAVAAREEDGEKGGKLTLSLGSNPDVTFELAERQAAQGKPLLKVGVVNRQMPFMPNHAVAPDGFFDVVVTDAEGTHTLFAPPNNKVGTADYAIGLHAASLVADGGTLQIGIGALGDAIAQALIVRDRDNAEYRRIMAALSPNSLQGRELGGFEQGLYACSEMFVNGILKLIEAGIVRREVFEDVALQRLVNEGHFPDLAVNTDTLAALIDAGRISATLSADDLQFLQRFGVLSRKVQLSQDGSLDVAGTRIDNRLGDPAVRAALQNAGGLGGRLTGGVILHGGFFLGPTDFYGHLRAMPPEALAKIDMTRIDFINQLQGQSRLKQAQRTQGRFMNTTMMVTLLGAAVSDGLESGQVVSGVGGQYNFVAMAHALPGARSILMLRSTYDHKDGVRSTLVWNYAYETIPRHLRDMVITEYGVADLRAQPDGEVVKRLIAIADSRFQDDLVAKAKAAGKLSADYEVPEQHRQNLPEVLRAQLQPWNASALLPDFPFGTDLTADELRIVGALRQMQHASQHPAELVAMLVKSLLADREAPPAYLQRLGLDDATSLRKILMRKLFAGNL